MSSKEGSGKKKYNLRSKPTDALKKSSNDDSDKPEQNEEIDMERYQELLAKLYPSKFLDEKVSQLKSILI